MSDTENQSHQSKCALKTPATVVDGVLVAITAHPVKGKNTAQYMVEQKNGERVTFLATWDLAQRSPER